MTHADPVVTTAWLADQLDNPAVRVVDASWFMAGTPRDPKAEFEAGHIPGAVFFDIDEISDHGSPLPHMLADEAEFANKAGALGLGDGVRIVVYDSTGILPAARVWWNLRVMGHEDVAVLDGGLPKWVAEGRPLEQGPARPAPRAFVPRLQPDLVRSFGQMKQNLSTGREQVVDARAAARFTGETPEPRAGLASGHIPGSRNLPLAAMLAPDATLLPADALSAAFANAGIDVEAAVAATCGSGITAAVVALALHRLGKTQTAVYDGSWTEWGGRSDAPVQTGPAD